MGLLSNILSAAVKITLTPLAALKDTATVMEGKKPKTTKKLIKSALKDIVG